MVPRKAIRLTSRNNQTQRRLILTSCSVPHTQFHLHDSIGWSCVLLLCREPHSLTRDIGHGIMDGCPSSSGHGVPDRQLDSDC